MPPEKMEVLTRSITLKCFTTQNVATTPVAGFHR